MKTIDHIKKSGLKSSDESLNLVIELYEKGLSLGEVFFNSKIWSDKSLNLWNLDKCFYDLNSLSKFNERKIKYVQDLTKREVDQAVVDKLNETQDVKVLEHYYRPYKRKKKTRVTLAREAGLQKFAEELLENAKKGENFSEGIESAAKKYIQPALGYITFEHVLKGAQDIIVDQVLKDRFDLRLEVFKVATSEAKISIQAGEKFQENSRFSSFVKSPAHKTAFYKNPKNFDKFPIIKKAWEDGHLKVSLDFDLTSLKENFEKAFAPDGLQGDLTSFLKSCAKKAFEVHVLPSVTTEVFDDFYETSRAVYIDKLKKDYLSLLNTPAFGEKSVLSLYEKSPQEVFLVLVSHKGDYVSSTTIDSTKDDVVENLTTVLGDIVKNIDLGAIALPLSLNSRQLEKFFKKALENLKKSESVPLVYVSSRGIPQFIGKPEAKFNLPSEKESGKIDNFILSAFRLAKRLQDPLYEYAEHEPSKLLDVPSFIESEALDKELFKILSFAVCRSGLESKNVSPGLIQNLNWFKEDAGETIDEVFKFSSDFRSTNAEEKKNLESLIPKSFTRFSKFFKFSNALNLLDKSRISVDDFSKIKDFFKDNELSLLKGPLDTSNEKWTTLFEKDWVNYINSELSAPFKDLRKDYKVFSFSKSAFSLEDLVVDNLYWGVVSKFSSFGAFVDLGVGVNGLVHLSELSNEYVSDPRKVLRLDQWILIKLLKVDVKSKQISLSKTKADQRNDGKREGRRDSSFKNSNKSGDRSNSSYKGSKSGYQGKGSGKSKRFDKSEGSKNTSGRKPFDKNSSSKKRSTRPFNNPFAQALGDLKD